MIRLGKSTVSRALGRDVMGYWYSKEEFARIANAHGLEASFSESPTFPYRFHATLRLKSQRPAHHVHEATLAGPAILAR
jgi:hypothetical protein